MEYQWNTIDYPRNIYGKSKSLSKYIYIYIIYVECQWNIYGLLLNIYGILAEYQWNIIRAAHVIMPITLIMCATNCQYYVHDHAHCTYYTYNFCYMRYYICNGSYNNYNYYNYYVPMQYLCTESLSVYGISI